jgi:CheY-like chemotaxis protein
MQKPSKLLIVGNGDSVRASLVLMFSRLGYLVRSSADGSSGLSEIRKEIPDVLLSDFNMVRLPGVEFLKVVRNWLPSIRVIAMAETTSGSFAAGVAADVILRKGAGPAQLIRAVDAMTDPKRSACRLSMEDSFGFRFLEAIPTHPTIEQLAFPARREMASPAAQKERPGKIFLVPAIAPAAAVRAS